MGRQWRTRVAPLGVSALLLATAMMVATALPAVAETVVATVGVGGSPLGVGVNPSTNRIYVANGGDSTVSVIDGSTNAVVVIAPVGPNPDAVAVNRTTNRIYVANGGNNTVSVIVG